LKETVARPNMRDEFVDVLDEALVCLGYPEHVIEGATHTQKVAWLIVETNADVDVQAFV